MSFALFAALAPFVFATLLWVGHVAWQRRAVPGATATVRVIVLCAWWLLCSFGETIAPTAALSARSAHLAYLAIAWLPLAWLGFAFEFTGCTAWHRTPAVRALAVVAVVTSGLALAMPWHGLIWATAESVQVGPFRDTVVTYGPWFWVAALTSWATVLFGSGLIVNTYRRSFRSYQRLSAWLAVGATAPLAVNALFVLHLVDVGKDFSPISFALGAAALALGIARYRFLDLQPTGRAVVVEAMADAFAVVDAEGRVTDFNAALRRFAGPALALGAPLATALPRLAAALTDARGEVAMSRAGSGVRQFEWRATPLDGHRRGRLVLLRDVTERRAAETALRAALAELEARNEELDAFAHTVAHDLKNPIHVVHGYAELLLEEGDALAPELRRESVTAILRTAGTMGDIVHALLLLAGVRHQSVTPAPLDTGALVDGALVRLAPLLTQHGATVAVPDAWPVALGHGPWLEEVWVNYLSNAAKYGGPSARITLGAESAGDGAHVRFWVRDHGAGLPPDALDGLFAPFARFHGGATEGHGLGLSIVRRVVGKLGGRVGAEAAPGGGTIFWFTLPAAPGGASPAAPSVRRDAVDCGA